MDTIKEICLNVTDILATNLSVRHFAQRCFLTGDHSEVLANKLYLLTTHTDLY